MSNPSYVVKYGTFVFSYARLDVATTILYEDDHSTQIGTQYSFSVDAWIYGTPQSAASFAAQVNAAQCQLNTPRLPFSVVWDDGTGPTTLYAFEGTGQDIDFGPKPRNVHVTNFSGGLIARISFNVDVQVKACYDGSCGSLTRPTNVLSYTRATSIRINENSFTTITVSGKLTMTANGVTSGDIPDNYRNFVTPGLADGFQRKSMEFSVGPDRRTLSYHFEDVEYNNTLPPLITGGDASRTWRLSAMGAMATLSLHGEFSAPKNVPPFVILQYVANLISDTIPVAGGNQGFGIGESSITQQNFYRTNTIAFSITALCATQNIAITPTTQITPSLILGNLPNLSNPFTDSATDVAYFPNPYGTAGLIAVPFAVWDSCNGLPSQVVYESPDGTVGNPTNTPVKSATPDNQTPSGTPASYDSNGGLGTVTADQVRAPWFEYVDKLRWVSSNFNATMPSKSATSGPLIFQTAAPILTLLQAGYCRRMAINPTDVPKPAAPYYDATKAVMLDGSFNEPETVDPVGAGPYFIYGVRWFYKMRLLASVNSGVPSPTGSASGPTFPSDPRFNAQPQTFVPADGLITDATK